MIRECAAPKPTRVVARAPRSDQDDGRGRCRLDQQSEEILGRSIDPVEIFDDHDRRLAPRDGEEESQKSVQGARSKALGAEVGEPRSRFGKAEEVQQEGRGVVARCRASATYRLTFSATATGSSSSRIRHTARTMSSIGTHGTDWLYETQRPSTTVRRSAESDARSSLISRVLPMPGLRDEPRRPVPLPAAPGRPIVVGRQSLIRRPTNRLRPAPTSGGGAVVRPCPRPDPPPGAARTGSARPRTPRRPDEAPCGPIDGPPARSCPRSGSVRAQRGPRDPRATLMVSPVDERCAAEPCRRTGR